MRRYGICAAADFPPIRKMLECGLTVAAGTDDTRVSTYSPWGALHWLVSGRSISDILLRPRSNRVDRQTALTTFTRAGAELTGEENVNGLLPRSVTRISRSCPRTTSPVPEPEIAHIESLLTVTGGRIACTVGEYEGPDEELPPVSPARRPVAHFGGYQTSRPHHAGGRQAELLGKAVAESEQHRTWRKRRCLFPETTDTPFDPCFPREDSREGGMTTGPPASRDTAYICASRQSLGDIP